MEKDKDVRKSVGFQPDIWQRIADFRFGNRIETEAEALRRLVEAGLETLTQPPPQSLILKSAKPG